MELQVLFIDFLGTELDLFLAPDDLFTACLICLILESLVDFSTAETFLLLVELLELFIDLLEMALDLFLALASLFLRDCIGNAFLLFLDLLMSEFRSALFAMCWLTDEVVWKHWYLYTDF